MLFASPPEPTPEVALTILRGIMRRLAQKATTRALSGRVKDVYDDLMSSFEEAGETATPADRRDARRQAEAAVARGDDKPRPAAATFQNHAALAKANVPGFARPPPGSVRSVAEMVSTRPTSRDPDTARPGQL